MTTRDELVGHIADQKRRYQAVSLSHEQADALVRLASRQEVSVEELADALQVMVMAWEAKTTADARQSIGLSADIAFPAMPRAIKSYADARAVLQKVRP